MKDSSPPESTMNLSSLTLVQSAKLERRLLGQQCRSTAPRRRRLMSVSVRCKGALSLSARVFTGKLGTGLALSSVTLPIASGAAHATRQATVPVRAPEGAKHHGDRVQTCCVPFHRPTAEIRGSLFKDTP